METAVTTAGITLILAASAWLSYILAREQVPRLAAGAMLGVTDSPVVMHVLQWSRHYRCIPGQGEFDLTAFVAHVLAAGYAGPLSLEVFNDVFRQADADRTAVDAMRSLLLLEQSLGSPARHDLSGTIARLDLCAPPAPVQPTGFAFAEITVDHVSARKVERVLTALGFRRTGHHRSKPVHLWVQGQARVLLNHGDARVADNLHGDALVSALALEVGDPRRGLPGSSSCGRRASRATTVPPRPTCRRSGRQTAPPSSSAAPPPPMRTVG